MSIAAILLISSLMLHADTLRIASYNVQNLFDLHYDGNEYAEYIPNTTWQWNRKHHRIKCRNIARVIAQMKPDIIALQEIESRRALRDLQAEINRAGHPLPYLAIADAKPTTVKTALLSNIPIAAKREIRVTQSKTLRNILEVIFHIDGEPLHCFVNHWKAKSGPESRRVISAKALRRRLDALQSPAILLGDFNSDVEEKRRFIRKRRHNDTDGRTGINDVLRTMQGGEPVTLQTLRRSPGCFYSLWYDLPREARWSHRYRGDGEALDAIIINAALADGRGLEYEPGSFSRFMPDWLLKNGAPYRWQSSRGHPKHHLGKGFSDHLPIYAHFSGRNGS